MILALDIGGTFIKSGVVSPDGTLRKLPQIPSRSEGGRAEIVSAIRSAVDAAGEVDAVGIAIPGPFDYCKGISLMTHKFGALNGVDLRVEIGLAVPCVFVHDADAFLLGELSFGLLRGMTRAGAVTLGTGLGAAVAVNGATVDNDLGSPASEVSLWKQPFHGGIAEDFISARALLKKYPAAGVKAIADAAKNGDAVALRVWREFGEELAELLTQWSVRWKLEKIALGGQIAGAWELFHTPLEKLPIAPSELPDAALYGAYLKALAR
jgi:glucokinase